MEKPSETCRAANNKCYLKIHIKKDFSVTKLEGKKSPHVERLEQFYKSLQYQQMHSYTNMYFTPN